MRQRRRRQSAKTDDLLHLVMLASQGAWVGEDGTCPSGRSRSKGAGECKSVRVNHLLLWHLCLCEWVWRRGGFAHLPKMARRDQGWGGTKAGLTGKKHLGGPATRPRFPRSDVKPNAPLQVFLCSATQKTRETSRVRRRTHTLRAQSNPLLGGE